MQTLAITAERPRFLVWGARRRRLGSLVIPIRRSYVFIMPAMLLGGAVFGWALGNDFAMIVDAVLLGSIAAYLFFDLLGRRGPLRVTHLLAATLGLAYGLGTANTWFTLPRGDETLGVFLGLSPSDLSHAMATILAAIAILLIYGELFETPVFGEEFQLAFNNRTLTFLTIGTLVIIGSFLHGSTGFMGAATSDVGANAGHVGVLASLSEWLSSPLLAVSACLALNGSTRFTRNYARVLTVILFVLTFPLGRRVMFYAIVLCIISLRLGRYKLPFSPLKKAVYLGLVGGVVYAASIGFYYLRLGSSGLVKPTLVQRVEAAIALSHQKSYTEIKAQISENVENRTFILGFLSELEGYTDSMDSAHGQDLVSQVELAIPSALDPGKDLFFSEESLANDLFGSNFPDEANSVFTAGAIDFGVWGMLFYPLLFAVIMRLFLEVVSESLPVFVSCFIVLATCSQLLEPEIAVTAYVIVIRDAFSFGLGVWFINSLPEFRFKKMGL
jgi:hypothetical protein